MSSESVEREEFAPGRNHLTVSGNFQSDKFRWCAVGFVPLKITDPAARDLLAEYAERRAPVDSQFPRDLLEALANIPEKPNPKYAPFDTKQEIEKEYEELRVLFLKRGVFCDSLLDQIKVMRDALEFYSLYVDKKQLDTKATDTLIKVVALEAKYREDNRA